MSIHTPNCPIGDPFCGVCENQEWDEYAEAEAAAEEDERMESLEYEVEIDES